jgi:membrane fusion protein (multidrug efflux system)
MGINHHQKMQQKPIVSIRHLMGMGTMALLLASCSSKQAPPKGPAAGQPPTVVDVIIAKQTTIDASLEVNGEVSANEYVELHPEVSGRLVYLNVPEGANVAAGTLIARINDADLQAQLSKINVQLKLATENEARLKKLLDINGINLNDYDAALGQKQSLEADLAYTQALIDKTVVKAPFAGRLGLRQVSPGAYVTPATTIASLQQVQQLKVDFSIPEAYSLRIKTGDTIEISTDFDNGRRQRATISAIEPQVNRDTRNLKVRAVLDGQQANPGAFAKVYLQPAGGDQTGISIPTNAIIPDAMSKKVVTVKGGKAVFVAVETGVRQDRLIEITSGLQVGDTVVVNGVLFARPNAPVQVRDVKQLDALGAE